MQVRARRPDRGPEVAGGGTRRGRPAGGGRPLNRDGVVAACGRWGAVIESWVDADYSAVAFVRLADGTAAVAKESPGIIDGQHEADALAAWDGVGAVRLLARDDAGVVLQERAVPGTPATDDTVVASSLAVLWILPPVGVAWRRFDIALVGWRASLRRWRAILGDDVVDSARAASTGDDLERPSWRLLHGDGHHGNVLDGGPDRGWLRIDPQPLVGPPGYDLATALWNGPDVGVDVEARIAVLAAASGVAETSIRRWARFRSALSVAWDLDDGVPLGRVAERALTVARQLATTVPEP